jgi:hypothetical protein
MPALDGNVDDLPFLVGAITDLSGTEARSALEVRLDGLPHPGIALAGADHRPKKP